MATTSVAISPCSTRKSDRALSARRPGGTDPRCRKVCYYHGLDMFRCDHVIHRFSNLPTFRDCFGTKWCLHQAKSRILRPCNGKSAIDVHDPSMVFPQETRFYPLYRWVSCIPRKRWWLSQPSSLHCRQTARQLVRRHGAAAKTRRAMPRHSPKTGEVGWENPFFYGEITIFIHFLIGESSNLSRPLSRATVKSLEGKLWWGPHSYGGWFINPWNYR